MSIINNMYLLTGTIGLFFATAPFFLHYSENIFALITSICIGISSLLASLLEKYHTKRKTFLHKLVEIVGLVIFVVPLQFGFTPIMTSILLANILLHIYIVNLDSKIHKKKIRRFSTYIRHWQL